ncbi:MAG: outer membrane lipoprotein-sorting protein [Desulfurivibrio sp.]|nr:MAG: outer membrane lipoprotein-sorting protein [Desulfurivibrio sp.]
MMKKTFPVLSLATIFLSAATCVFAATSVEEIVNKANTAAYYAGQDGKALADMTSTDSQGRTSSRQFVILRRDDQDGGNQQFYVFCRKPGEVRKTVLLVHKYTDKDEARWMYLPDLDQVKRIAAADKRTSFMGSHFFYEDVSGRGINADKHELLEEDEKFYVVKNIPKDPVSVEFSSYRVWIDKKTFLPMKAEYADKADKPYRVVEALAVEDIQGHPTVTKSRVQDFTSGGETVTEFSNITYDLGLDAAIFTEGHLFKPPKEVYK